MGTEGKLELAQHKKSCVEKPLKRRTALEDRNKERQDNTEN